MNDVRTAGVTSATVGPVLAAGSLGSVMGAMLARVVGRRFGTSRGMPAMHLLTGPWALLIPLTSPGADLLLFTAGAFPVGVGITACNVVLGSFRQTYCPPRPSARRGVRQPRRPSVRHAAGPAIGPEAASSRSAGDRSGPGQAPVAAAWRAATSSRLTRSHSLVT